MSLVLLRHGQADGRDCCYGQRHDVPLSAEGREQARAAVSRLAAPALLVSSPATRARATAACFGLDARIDERWAERDFGVWEGRPWAECWTEVPPEITEDPERYGAFTPPGGEPLDVVQARVAAALDELAHERQPVVVVTHAGPIRLALRQALGLDLAQAFAFTPAPGSVTELRRMGDRWIVPRMGA